MIGVIYEMLSANVKRPAGLLLSDPRVAADLRLHLTNLLPLDRSLFAFVLCFYDNKSSKKQKCGENASIGVNYEEKIATDLERQRNKQRAEKGTINSRPTLVREDGLCLF